LINWESEVIHGGTMFWAEVRKTVNPAWVHTHWPEINSAVLTIIPDEKVDGLLESVKKLDNINKEVGVRAFVWDVLKSV
jgi:hypothetical protein